MSNSKLVSYTSLSPNHSGRRTHAIDRITPHAVVGQLSVERICGCFAGKDRQASCNYPSEQTARSAFALMNRIVPGVHHPGTTTSGPLPLNAHQT